MQRYQNTKAENVNKVTKSNESMSVNKPYAISDKNDMPCRPVELV